MENASKALVMVGGVLLGILLIGLVIYVFGQPSEMYKSIDDKEQAKKIEKFNKEYEGYNRKNLRGTDIVSAMNKVSSHNWSITENIYEITMEVTIKPSSEGLPILPVAGSQQMYNLAQITTAYNNLSEDDKTKFKKAKFEGAVDYSAETIRVNKLIFTHKPD